MKKKFYGILIVLLPFITGTYKNLVNWSNSEAIGYNVFTLLLIFGGIYLIFKSPQQNILNKGSFDDLISKGYQTIKNLELKAKRRRDQSDDTDHSTLELIAETEAGLKLFKEARTSTSYDTTKLESITIDLQKYLEIIYHRNIKNEVLWIGATNEDVDQTVKDLHLLRDSQKEIEDRLKHFLKS